ncbi:CLUMA_CG010286, isoform A [Clunio marinus]|uniref:CLUMA_CG010286, isoform A n=1 Tax=Clunio marinus TaxID=568069 RepID=A0A1J1I8U4_9DIPT|nr:CLUMA_CG010286, isoform A [Clunio marinus]
MSFHKRIIRRTCVQEKRFERELCHIYVTCISEGEADRYKKCFQNYAEKTGHVDAYCETKIVELREGIDDSIKSILKRENMTECGWKLFKDYKVDDIAFNAFIQQYTNSTIDEKCFDEEIKNIFEKFAQGAKSYCFPEFIGNHFDKLERGDLDASDSHMAACVFKYLISIKIIDPKLHNVSEEVYTNENCEAEFAEWRESFPSVFFPFAFNFYDGIFGLGTAKVVECELQKTKEEKLNEQMFSCRILAFLDQSDAQLQESRINFINLNKKYLKIQLQCLDKIFECAVE